MTSKRVRYFGRVQGVGFRYTTQALAEKHAVAGFVRNLPDGTVELVAEGSAEQVEALLEDVARRMSGHVERATVEDGAVVGYRDFVIQR